MDELKKISRIVHQQAEGCSLETLLVLDATTGQNAVNQAKLFSETADITGIVLTKLDGTAKGGIIISIHRELGIPVKLVGVGEKLDDLQDFHARDFVEALFETDTDFDYNYERLSDGENGLDEYGQKVISEEALPETIEEELETEEIFDADETPEEAFEETQNIIEENSDEIAGSEAEPEQSAESGKKNLKDGKFGFLFKEITFGKKNKETEADDE